MRQKDGPSVASVERPERVLESGHSSGRDHSIPTADCSVLGRPSLTMSATQAHGVCGQDDLLIGTIPNNSPLRSMVTGALEHQSQNGQISE